MFWTVPLKLAFFLMRLYVWILVLEHQLSNSFQIFNLFHLLTETHSFTSKSWVLSLLCELVKTSLANILFCMYPCPKNFHTEFHCNRFSGTITKWQHCYTQTLHYWYNDWNKNWAAISPCIFFNGFISGAFAFMC